MSDYEFKLLYKVMLDQIEMEKKEMEEAQKASKVKNNKKGG